MEDVFRTLGAVAGGAMPLFNIPLMIRIYKRRSADDVSLSWEFGVWGCMLLMVPSAIQTSDIVLKIFGIANAVLYAGVVAVVVYFRFIRPPAANRRAGEPAGNVPGQ